MKPEKKRTIGLDQRVDFERYKETYRQEIQKSINFIGQDLEFFTERKAELFLEEIRRHVGAPSGLKVLDVGCGVGITDYYLTPHFKKLHGVDLSRGIVNKAAALNPKASFRAYGGKTLPYKDASMDVTFAICVMHHVEPVLLERFVDEMVRVTRKGGMLAVFEHNPWNPLTRLAVSRCDLDEDANLLSMGKIKRLLVKSGAQIQESGFIFFTPYRGKFFKSLDAALGWCPLGAQSMVIARKP